MRDEVLAVLPSIVDAKGVFRLRDLVAALNHEADLRRRWAIEKALWRLMRQPDQPLQLQALGQGRFQLSTDTLANR